MILLIQIHSIPFHYYEFVKPIEDVVKKTDISFSSIHYDSLEPHHLEDADKIIISGTSLKDQSYLKDIDEFRWLTTINVPVLGICGGMQILAVVFNEDLINGTEIGLHNISFKKECLGFSGEVEVYALHHNSVKPNFFEIIAKSDQQPQVIKHQKKPFFGVLFHPEVRNKEMIINFLLES